MKKGVHVFVSYLPSNKFFDHPNIPTEKHIRKLYICNEWKNKQKTIEYEQIKWKSELDAWTR